MMFVSQARTVYDDTREDESTIIAYYKRGAERFVPESVFDFGRDMIVNNRNLYLAVSYVQNNERTLGRTFLTQILSVVPGLQSVYVTLFHVDLQDISSGQLLTYHEYEGGSWRRPRQYDHRRRLYFVRSGGRPRDDDAVRLCQHEIQRGGSTRSISITPIAYVVSCRFPFIIPARATSPPCAASSGRRRSSGCLKNSFGNRRREGSPFAGSGA